MIGASCSAILVNWNTRDLLADALRNLQEHAAPSPSPSPPGGEGRVRGGLEIIVVDNGSADDSAEMVRSDWPGVRLIANARNEGFTHANNQAIEISGGEYLLLINTDARLTPGCLDTMLDIMEGNPRIGAVAPRLVYGDGRWQRWTAGRAPTLWTALNYYLFLERLFPGRPAFRGMYLGQDVRRSCEVDWVCSACMLVRRAALDEVGLLDERFFVYMDDVDLCQRLRDGGWRVWYCPEGEAVHFGSHNRPGKDGAVSTVALRAFNRYFARQNGRLAMLALKPVQAVGYGLRALGYGAAAALQGGDAQLRAQARAHATFCRLSLEPSLNPTIESPREGKNGGTNTCEF